MKHVDQISLTDTNQLQQAIQLSRSCEKGNQDRVNCTKASPHHLHTSTRVTSSPISWKAGADSIISIWHNAFWAMEMKLKRTAPVSQVDSNKKKPQGCLVGGWCLRTCENGGSGTWAFKKHGNGRAPLTRRTFKFRACETCPVEWKQLASSSSHSSKWQHLATWKWMNK